MPNVPVEFIRGVLGLLCLFFGYMAGRSAAAVQKGRMRVTRLYTWLLRMVVCSIGLVIRSPIDSIAIGVWILSLAAAGAGYYMVQHEKAPEDLTHQIFPE